MSDHGGSGHGNVRGHLNVHGGSGHWNGHVNGYGEPL